MIVDETSCPAAPSPASLRLVPIDWTAIDELGADIVAMAGRLAAATCRWLLLVADFDARDGYARWNLGSTARWLAFACGLSQRTATDHVRVARALAAHPPLSAEMAAGRLSYSHVRAISRIVSADDATLVGDLVAVAQNGTVAQLESVVCGLRTVDELATAEDEGGAPAERVNSGGDSCGRWRCGARLAPERGAVVDSALDALMAAEELSRPDALVRMAEIALAALNDSAHPPRALRGDERAAIVIHVDASRVEGADKPESGSAEPIGSGPPYARLANGPGLSDATVKRLACAGRVRTVVFSRDPDGGDSVLDVGRSHRVVTERQFRALLIRDDGACTHPGCTSTRGLEAHHVVHWMNGGLTNLNNLVLLCPRHHHAHHDGVFIIRRVESRFEFCRADGTLLRIDSRPDESGPIEAEPGEVDPTAAGTRWTGQRLDRHYAVSVLAARRAG
jgi:hypothetical protein